MSRRLIGVAVALAVLGLGHELALRAVLDHDVAGALLAGGTATTTILAAAGTLALRLLTYAAVTAAPAIVVYGLAARHRAAAPASASGDGLGRAGGPMSASGGLRARTAAERWGVAHACGGDHDAPTTDEVEAPEGLAGKLEFGGCGFRSLHATREDADPSGSIGPAGVTVRTQAISPRGQRCNQRRRRHRDPSRRNRAGAVQGRGAPRGRGCRTLRRRRRLLPCRPMYLDPTPAQGAAFFGNPPAGPVVMLNLLRFRDTADYSRHPDLAPSEPIRGAAAYELYAAHTLPFLTEAGGRVLFAGDARPFLTGPSDERWHHALLVEHVSAQAFLAFASNEPYLAGLGHRTAALADSRLPLSPTGGFIA